LSFFEMTVGMAFDYFANEQVDIAIIEVGLGGRLDSTNIIIPEVAVITNIGFDHTQFLGETLPEIAFEKAGIMGENVPVVIGERQEEVVAVFLNKAIETTSNIVFASENTTHYKTDLLGNYQKKNVLTALAAIEQLKGFDVSREQLQNGLLRVAQNTNLKGRWQILKEQPMVICDTAHNKEGLEIVLNQLRNLSYSRLHFVLGVVSDKDLERILPMFPTKATYYFCKPNIPRGLSEVILQEKASEFNLKGEKYESVEKAYSEALLNVNQNDMIYIGGSTFVVAEII